MGNSLGCSPSGERLVSAARDGDLLEAQMLLEFHPGLARYSTFGSLNSPLHFAAARGHNEIVMLLLESGADANARNYCGQVIFDWVPTALMQACRYGHWVVVQSLLLFRCNVSRTDYLSGRTALHFAAMDGHVRCMRLVVADFLPSAPHGASGSSEDGALANGNSSPPGRKYDSSALSKLINKSADGGITALHMAALNGHFDCVQLLLELHANVSGVTFHYGSSVNLIGSGSTPLHYAACGGNLKCCQILLAKGASRLTLNCNGWLPVDVARTWKRYWLEPLLRPNSVQIIPTFPPSSYLSLPLLSILNIARDFGLQSRAPCDDSNICAVCLESACTVAAEGCAHELCVKCALYLCSTSTFTSDMVNAPGSIPCPLCRQGIIAFTKLPTGPSQDLKPNLAALGLCSLCPLQPFEPDAPPPASKSDVRKNRVASISIPTCCRHDDPCMSAGPDGRGQEPSVRGSPGVVDQGKPEEQQLDRASCSSMFRCRRSCHREQRCDSEIST